MQIKVQTQVLEVDSETNNSTIFGTKTVQVKLDGEAPTVADLQATLQSMLLDTNTHTLVSEKTELSTAGLTLAPETVLWKQKSISDRVLTYTLKVSRKA